MVRQGGDYKVLMLIAQARMYQACTYRSTRARADGRHVIAHRVEESGPIIHGGDLATGRSAERQTAEEKGTGSADG